MWWLALFALLGVRAQAQTPGEDPYPRRPVCASMYLSSDLKLSAKQTACDWIQNRMFSTTAMAAAAWSAGYQQVTQKSSDLGKGTPGFSTRFATNFAQSTAKSTGAYLGGRIFHEDPRPAPPYLWLLNEQHPRGFWNRLAFALKGNFVSYRCVGACSSASDVQRRPAISRITGAFASGFSSEAWAPDRLSSPGRDLRRTASAYGTGMATLVFSEFRPELSALGNKVVTKIFGVR